MSTPQTRPDARLPLLNDLSTLALRAGSIDELTSAAIAAVARELDVPRVGMFDLAGGGSDLLLRRGTGWRADQIGVLTVPVVTLLKGERRAPSADPSPEPLLPIGMVRGVSVPVDAGGQAHGALGVYTDELDRAFTDDEITFLRAVAEVLAAALERARVEQSLTSSQQRLAMAQRIAHMGSYDWHIASDTNVWSDELYRIYGAEPQSFNASYERFLSFIHPDDRERVVAVHRRAFETLEPYEMEERIIRPDGQVRILETNGEVITDEAGRPVRMVGICFDVTEQRAAAETARKYEEMQAARRQALEINDSVVQGLATVVYALERQRTDLALRAIDRTLTSVREMVNDLLTDPDAGAIEPGLLRRAGPPARCLPGEPPKAGEPVAGPISVVIADDSDDMRMMLRLALDPSDGFAVVGEAADGRAALEVIAETSPDVVLLDLAMPTMDGLEVARALQQRGAACRVVVLSGFDAGRLSSAALGEGAVLYLEKGTPMSELRARIAALFPDRIVTP